MEKAYLKKIAWKEIRNKVLLVNPILTAAIDEVDPKDDLYIASYPYGSTIVSNGIFHIPLSNGEIVPIHDTRVNNQIKNDFEFTERGIPPGIVLKNSYELFINSRGHILPILTTAPGSIFALWKGLEAYPSFHPVKIFNITSGTRCVFMLPNISDHSLHKNLKRDFNVRQAPPKNLLDQWEIFKTIVNNPNSKCNWTTELLFFSKKWLTKIKNDKAWASMLLLLLQEVWDSCAYERNRAFYDFTISCAQAKRNLKPNPYISDTLRHILMICVGTAVGFSVSQNDQAAPIELIKKVYLDSYGLRRYAPTMMHPVHFSFFEKCNPVYYSLALPTTLEFSPKSRKVSSTLNNLTELKQILTVFLNEVRNGHLKIDDTVIGSIAKHLCFDYFHNKFDRHSEIKLTNQITKDDPLLIKSLKEYKNREFAESGTFVRGCVRISHKNSS